MYEPDTAACMDRLAKMPADSRRRLVAMLAELSRCKAAGLAFPVATRDDMVLLSQMFGLDNAVEYLSGISPDDPILDDGSRLGSGITYSRVHGLLSPDESQRLDALMSRIGQALSTGLSVQFVMDQFSDEERAFMNMCAERGAAASEQATSG